MPATPQQTEALKLISDWSKWIAAIETGAIAVIGDLAKKAQLNLVNCGYSVSVMCFVTSIACAAAVLLSLPASVQDIGENDKVWDRPCAVGPVKPPLRRVVGAQFLFFLIGTALFGMSIVYSLLTSP